MNTFARVWISIDDTAVSSLINHAAVLRSRGRNSAGYLARDGVQLSRYTRMHPRPVGGSLLHNCLCIVYHEVAQFSYGSRSLKL